MKYIMVCELENYLGSTGLGARSGRDYIETQDVLRHWQWHLKIWFQLFIKKCTKHKILLAHKNLHHLNSITLPNSTFKTKK